MTLYLKYRPKNLDELDLPDVSESLKKIVKSGNIPHAFLFAGPKGTGKTSAARILAKIINCESKNPPCDKCEQCLSITRGNNLDVIEMDAASHRGIDDVRILRDAVKLSPTKAKKKIYIIDEAHMLTTEASNALLKTLEEPPSHVIFILATTNPEKLIETIKSRTTFISFRKASEPEIKNSLERAVKGEKIKIDDETIKNIARLSNGSFRDAVKNLEQFTMEGPGFLKKDDITGVEEFVGLLYKKDTESLLKNVQALVQSGVSVENFMSMVLLKIQKDMIENAQDRKNLITLAELLINANRSIPDSPIEELPLEIAVIKWCGAENISTGSAEKIKIEEQEPAQTVISSTREQTAVSASEIGVNDEAWRLILATVKPINASIEALLRAARPIAYDGKTLTLGVFYKFHKERLEDIQHRRVLESIVAEVLKSPTKIICTLVEPPPRKIIEETKTETVLTEGADKDIIKVAEEIFGN